MTAPRGILFQGKMRKHQGYEVPEIRNTNEKSREENHNYTVSNYVKNMYICEAKLGDIHNE